MRRKWAEIIFTVGIAGAEMNTARASGFKTIPSTRLHRPSSKAAINVAFLPVVAHTGGRQSLPLLCIAFSESYPPTIKTNLVNR